MKQQIDRRPTYIKTGSHYVAQANCTSSFSASQAVGISMCTSFDGLILHVDREGKKQVTATTGASTCTCQGEKQQPGTGIPRHTEPLLLSLCLVDLVMEGS